ncbi:glycosyltransferase family 2 protein [Companilactobacillus ginsenosidimutans]|uniref:Glycosyltransferase 2-like domain-containing protein n=1 Tax=Companilactobacillus ginsenosidimutans TaxID=1007676 RepID=A0A0H4R114_9LACO|nr:glycosyltransferase family 2 protein [Companilactobacillus ginsenosidimutans]AKP67395.1 hypothetical protein ABM34_07485 [Companilactobacillus ginsenosidimutans]
MNTCAVIVTYNRRDLLKKCLINVLDQALPVNNIFVFNNDSDDGTQDMLEKEFGDDSKIHVYNSPKNIGGAPGFSEALKKAYQTTDDDYFWIMDDDTIPTATATEGFQTAINNLDNNFGFLCSKVLWKDGSTVNAPIIDRYIWANKLASNVIGVERATFVSILVKREMVRNVGIPAADMVIWGDDTEYTMRLSNQKESYLVLDSTVYHDTAKNTNNLNILNDDIERMGRYFYKYRNAITTTKMYSTKVQLGKITLKNFKEVGQICFSKNTNKLMRSKTIIKGMLCGFAFKPKIEKVHQ